MRRALLLSLALALPLAACSWSRFSDFQDRAPVARISPTGDIKSASFGDGLVGLDRGATNTGGALLIVGNGDAALTTATITLGGAANVAQSETKAVKEQLDSPTRINAAAAALAVGPVSGLNGPFAFLGTTAGVVGTVRVVDINSYARAAIYDPTPFTPTVSGFGLSVAPADLGSGAGRLDLAVGARGAIVLLRGTPGTWPLMNIKAPAIITGGSLAAQGEFKTMVTGNLDGKGEEEVVAAVPDQNTVVVVWGTKACLDGAASTAALCSSVLRLDAPAGARSFGAALLVAQRGGRTQLLVGAPDSNQVYVYEFGDAHFQVGATPPAPLATIAGPPGASGFGTSLAHGAFDGVTPLLAVGAPLSEAAGKADAGRIFLYDAAQKLVTADGVALANPEAGMLIGRRLATLPFRSGASASGEVLAAAGRDAVFIFFGSLTPGHKDVRQR